MALFGLLQIVHELIAPSAHRKPALEEASATRADFIAAPAGSLVPVYFANEEVEVALDFLRVPVQ